MASKIYYLHHGNAKTVYHWIPQKYSESERSTGKHIKTKGYKNGIRTIPKIKTREDNNEH